MDYEMPNTALAAMKGKIEDADKMGEKRYEAELAELAAYKAKDLTKAVIGPIEDQVATGSPITPEPTVKIGGNTLTKGTDYDLSYTGNTAVGTATVTATGKGAYFFAKTATFAIVAAPEENGEQEPES